jgi:putative ABC transport system permease protein
MLGYYFELAVRSLRRNVVLTTLMILAIGVGIGASMTALTVLRAMAADPIPEKSSQLFIAQMDTFGPITRRGDPYSDIDLLPVLTYRDAVALMQARREVRQAAIYPVRLDVNPPQGKPFAMHARAVSADFFSMFQAPFRSGNPWSSSDEEHRARVVVLGADLAQRLFPEGNAVGSELNLNERDYRIVGVLGPWNPSPRFYDMNHGGYEDPEELFIPFATAIDRQIAADGMFFCLRIAADLVCETEFRVHVDCPMARTADSHDGARLPAFSLRFRGRTATARALPLAAGGPAARCDDLAGASARHFR